MRLTRILKKFTYLRSYLRDMIKNNDEQRQMHIIFALRDCVFLLHYYYYYYYYYYY